MSGENRECILILYIYRQGACVLRTVGSNLNKEAVYEKALFHDTDH